MSEAKRWRRMDNLAHLFTPAASYHDPLVFRVSVTLTEAVEPDLLQKATEQALEYAPYFRSVIRKGFFWYYLEESDLTPAVHPENASPCAPLYRRGDPGLLFDVSYFENRVHLEVFHALCDGAGAIQFLKAIILLYWQMLDGGEVPDLSFLPSGIAGGQDNIDKHYEKSTIRPNVAAPVAYPIRGEHLPEERLGIVEGCMPIKPLLAQAKSHGATLTEYLAAHLIASIGQTMSRRDRRRPVVITIPADLRKFFPLDQSSRNFFSIMNIVYRFQGGDSFDDILAGVKAEFAQKHQAEPLLARMNLMASLERNLAVRAIPLFLKMPVLRLVNAQSKRTATASLSNVGRVDFPTELLPRLRDASVISSTRGLHVCVCSLGEALSITFASHHREVGIQRHFFRSLAQDGISVTISQTNGEEADG